VLIIQGLAQETAEEAAAREQAVLQAAHGLAIYLPDLDPNTDITVHVSQVGDLAIAAFRRFHLEKSHFNFQLSPWTEGHSHQAGCDVPMNRVYLQTMAVLRHRAFLSDDK